MATAPTPILLVDDRRPNLDALEAVLSSPEYELVSVMSGAEALDQLERKDFAVILLDVQMPGMDGIETASRIRARAASLGRRAPIIFLTAINSDRERILSGYASGAVDFIQKPVEPDVLSAKVAVFADLYRVRQRAKESGDRLAAAVTELEEALEETKRYRLLVESVKDYAIFILDTTGRVTTWNAGAQRIKGYALPEIVGRHFATFYPPEDVAASKPARELEVAARDGVFEEEGWRLRKDGTRFWANVVITAMRNERGELVGFAKVTRDLTERVRNEAQLRRMAAENAALAARAAAEATQQARREFLAKSGEALVSSLDYRTTLATVAQLAVPELADWCSVELVDPATLVPMQVAVAHKDPAKIQFARELGQRYPADPNAPTGVPQVIRSGKAELYGELPAALLEAGARDSEHLRIIQELRLESAMIVPLAGRERVLGAMSFIYADSGRRYTEADLAFAEDFARRAAMAIENAQAHAAQAAVLEFQERFVAVLGHDLRNPLSAIEMGAGLLRQRAGGARDVATLRVVERMTSSSRRMSRMIEQILDLTRSRIGGGLEMSFTEMDLVAMLAAIIDELRTAHPSRTIDVRCPPALLGKWDRDRLEQVFSNLIGNAIHYGAPEAPVRVEAYEDGDIDGPVRVEVHNEGPPIPEELQDNIFNPFRRGGRDSRKSRTAGLGLGLYISHAIVAAHRGELELRSTSAEGTTFRVTLPRRPSNLPSH